MRQIPDAYWTEAHGPVFAYATRDDVHACCVTWRDEYVVLFHDDLRRLPPDAAMEGVAEIRDLCDAVGDMLAPHYASGAPKRPRPRASHVGEAIFGQHLWYGAVYAPGEVIRQGWGRPSRVAAAMREAIDGSVECDGPSTGGGAAEAHDGAQGARVHARPDGGAR